VAVRIGILAPMPSELRPVVKRLGLRRQPGGAGHAVGRMVHEGRVAGVDVVAATTGMGTEAAAGAARRMLDGTAVDHVMVVGIAGGIDDHHAIGDVIVVDAVIDGRTDAEYRPHPLGSEGEHRSGGGALHTSDEFIVDPDRLAALRARGVVALDMETAAVAAVCEERRRPWSVFRAISDRSGDGMADEAVFQLAHPDGSPNLPAVVGFVVRHPRRIAHLLRLGRDMRIATNAAAAAVTAVVERCGRNESAAG
jgi:adenosylhomocysteine nucleosidase